MGDIAKMASITVGCEVWSTERRRAVPGDEVAKGGIVVRVTESFDQETGEVDRAFLCIDPYSTRPFLQWSLLKEAEVDRETVGPSEVNRLATLWRRLAEDVVFSSPHKRRKGMPLPQEVKLTEAMHELQVAVFGPEGELYKALEPPQPPRQMAEPRRSAPPNIGALCD